MIPMMKRRIPKWNNKGSALVSVFLTLMMLMILITGVLALSFANTKQAVQSDTYERSFYVAEGGAKHAADTLKSAALEYYRKLEEEVRSGTLTNNNAGSFFTYMDSVIYDAPQPDRSAGGPTSLAVAISPSALSSTTHRYTISSSAYGGPAARTVSGYLDFTFKPVIIEPAGSLPFANMAAISGGAFHMNNTPTSVRLDFRANGNVLFGSYDNPNRDPYYDGFSAYNENQPGWTDSTTVNSLKWDLPYSSIRQPPLEVTPSVNPAATINSNSFAPLGYNVPKPVYLKGLVNSNLTVTGFNITGGGQIYSYRKLTLDSGNYSGTASSYLVLYSEGDMTISGYNLSYIKIYCNGNVTLSGGNCNNVEIYAGGNINMGSGNFTDSVMVCDGAFTFNGGNISGKSVVYAKTSFTIAAGSTMSGIYYTAGNAYINGSGGMTGQLIAKGDIYANVSYQITYSQSLIDSILDMAFIPSLGGSSGEGNVIVPLNSEINSGSSAIKEK